jgi:cytochrome c-type biogenesis protein CcmE
MAVMILMMVVVVMMMMIIIQFNSSIQFFIIYVPRQQLQGQLQTQHSVGTNNNIMSKPNIKSKFN